MQKVLGLLVAGVIVALGLVVASDIFSTAYIEARTVDRVVTVKGLAEREVKADTALWPLKYTSTNDDLAAALAKIAADEAAVRAYLAAGGIEPDAVSVQQFAVVDQLAQRYRSGPVQSRFIVSQTLLVRTGHVDAVEALAQGVGELVAAGVILEAEGPGQGGPSYLFTQLNEIKPAMLAAALANARAGAAEFARDSGATVGGIRRASQGVFQILPRDQAPGLYEPGQVHKRVRVVSTIVYQLETPAGDAGD